MRYSKPILLLACAVSLSYSGCVTYGYRPGRYRVVHSTVSRAEAIFQDDIMAIQIDSDDMRWASVRIENVSDSPLTVLWDRSSYSFHDGDTSRIITAETRRIDLNRSQPPLTIGPGRSTQEGVVAVKAVESDFIRDWMTDSGSFTIAYEQDGQTLFVDVPVEVTEESTGQEIVGSVEVKRLRLHPLFIADPRRIRRDLREAATTQARATYGDDVSIINERFDSSWHPLSLIFMFSLYGWVEEAAIEATVMRTGDAP